MPQIVLLNHASGVNSKRMEARTKVNVDSPTDDKDPIVYKGKRLSKLTSDELTMYYGDMSSA